jgi:hypothetical protein
VGAVAGVGFIRRRFRYLLTIGKENTAMERNFISNPVARGWVLLALCVFTASAMAAAPAQVRIDSPLYDSEHVVGETIFFTSSIHNPAGGEITKASFVWTSSLNGKIGSGAHMNVSHLSVGLHRITLDVSGPSGIIGSDTVKIKVSHSKAGQGNDPSSDIGIGTGDGNYVPNPFN